MLNSVSSSSGLSYATPQTRGQGQVASGDQAKGQGGTDKASAGNSSQDSQQVDQTNIAQLKARDSAVRAHEQAHIAASGGLAEGGPSFVYQRGPDGKNYAIGGEVNIDASPGRTPQETITKAQLVRAAALAPADPSPQDRSVAAHATQMELQARAELLTQGSQQTAKSRELNGDSNPAIRAYSGADNGSSFNAYA
ncbi:putative metalloprotease CJM1_0395 family protein [Chitinivorax sp. PXF-14]|uniref:putative metalloprotease CJM1_0395 family protein n=1 Tax=Chitinivorax sp. PXF-14 TaxID=3230488 RepID=UPI003466B277